MVAAPLASCEQVKHVQDDQVRYLGVRVVASVMQVSWPRYPPSAQKRWLDECPGVGDPIDGLAHLLESLCFGGGALLLLRPECELGLATLARGRSWPALRRVCAWLWLPTPYRGLPSVVGMSLPHVFPLCQPDPGH